MIPCQESHDSQSYGKVDEMQPSSWACHFVARLTIWTGRTP